MTDLVTDLQYYMDGGIVALMDLCIKHAKHKWDNVIIIDGPERSGKSTLAKSMGYYYAYITGKKFGLHNVFFDPEEMLQYTVKKEEKVIIWDEAAFGGLSTQWQTKIQQKLNSMLMVTGKYRHFYIFIIPSFFRMNRYLAIDRSIALVHVYTPDLLKRGLFVCLNKEQKTWIYNNNRKSEMYGKSPSFRGRFTLKNTEKILSDTDYDEKKDKAILKYLDKSQEKEKIRFWGLEIGCVLK